MSPENIAPLVAWLASSDAKDVTGRVFEIAGGRVSVAEGWREGPAFDRGARWDAQEIGGTVRELIAQMRAPTKVYGA
jgi:hypothetical protein